MSYQTEKSWLLVREYDISRMPTWLFDESMESSAYVRGVI
jgi:hypothetical protein